jgi:hypothetical protein
MIVMHGGGGSSYTIPFLAGSTRDSVARNGIISVTLLPPRVLFLTRLEASVRLGHKTLRTWMKRSSLW